MVQLHASPYIDLGYFSHFFFLQQSCVSFPLSFLEASHGTCVSNVPNHSEMFERFERKLSPLWDKITGGQVGNGCGILNDGKSLYFNGPGKREARTVPLETTNLRSVG